MSSRSFIQASTVTEYLYAVELSWDEPFACDGDCTVRVSEHNGVSRWDGSTEDALDQTSATIHSTFPALSRVLVAVWLLVLTDESNGSVVAIDDDLIAVLESIRRILTTDNARDAELPGHNRRM